MMNLNTNLYNLNGVDVASVNKVTGQILKNAQNNTENKVNVEAIDYSKFNRKTLGIDLYSSRTSTDVQKQIAMLHAGLYAKNIDVTQMNSYAAAALYGAAATNKGSELASDYELASPKKIEEDNKRLVEFFNIQDGNSNSSNGYNPFMRTESSDETKGEKQ
ncbi:hypothetical protein IJ670_01715 [bacterium]|nr:hypothetical protein [bacterium]